MAVGNCECSATECPARSPRRWFSRCSLGQSVAASRQSGRASRPASLGRSFASGRAARAYGLRRRLPGDRVSPENSAGHAGPATARRRHERGGSTAGRMRRVKESGAPFPARSVRGKACPERSRRVGVLLLHCHNTGCPISRALFAREVGISVYDVTTLGNTGRNFTFQPVKEDQSQRPRFSQKPREMGHPQWSHFDDCREASYPPGPMVAPSGRR